MTGTEDGGQRAEGIANIEQGISNYEVEIATACFADLAMTRVNRFFGVGGTIQLTISD